MNQRNATKRSKKADRPAPKRKRHVSLKELQDWMRRGEDLFAILLARGGNVSKGMKAGVQKGLARLKEQTDRMVESWEKEVAERLEKKNK